MQIIANFWYVWIIVVVVALVFKSFLLHELKQGRNVKAVLWYGTTGVLYSGVALTIVGVILQIALFTKGA
jgi:hypothetical protein